MKNLLTLLLLVLCLSFITSCGSDVDCSNQAAFQSEVAQLSLVYFGAALSYSTDPSPANCETLKNSLSALVDRSKEIEECVPDEEKAEFDQDLKELEAELDALSC